MLGAGRLDAPRDADHGQLRLNDFVRGASWEVSYQRQVPSKHRFCCLTHLTIALPLAMTIAAKHEARVVQFGVHFRANTSKCAACAVSVMPCMLPSAVPYPYLRTRPLHSYFLCTSLWIIFSFSDALLLLLLLLLTLIYSHGVLFRLG